MAGARTRSRARDLTAKLQVHRLLRRLRGNVLQHPAQLGNRVGFIPVVHEVDGRRYGAWYRSLGGLVLEVYVDEQVARTLLGSGNVDASVRTLIEQIVRGEDPSPTAHAS
jgi:hypothetical protein